MVLIPPLAVAAARGANAQTTIGPGTITSTHSVTGSATVVGKTTINVLSGDGIDPPPYDEPGGALIINTELAADIGPGNWADLDHQHQRIWGVQELPLQSPQGRDRSMLNEDLKDA